MAFEGRAFGQAADLPSVHVESLARNHLWIFGTVADQFKRSDQPLDQIGTFESHMFGHRNAGAKLRIVLRRLAQFFDNFFRASAHAAFYQRK